MYLDVDTLIALVLFAALLGSAWFWSDNLKARELMLETCARLCRDSKLQFLDETVTLTSLRLGRSDAGWPQFIRRYQFEFSGTGQDRWQGRATLAGQRVISVQFERPEGVTILGDGVKVSPETARLSHVPAPGDKHTLH